MLRIKIMAYSFFSAIIITIESLTLAACAGASEEVKPPAIIPISLRESGAIITQKISVIDHHVYYFSLRFSFKGDDQADRARLKDLIGGHEIDKGGKPLKPGVPTPVWLGVYKVNSGQELEVFTKEIDPILTSWGGDHFSKQIGYIELKPGKYIVRLRSLRAAPEFNERPVALGIGYDKFKINFDSNK